MKTLKDFKKEFEKRHPQISYSINDGGRIIQRKLNLSFQPIVEGRLSQK